MTFSLTRHTLARSSIVVSALLLASAFAAQAQTGQTAAQSNTAIPALGAPQPLRLPPIVEKQLPNGLKIVVLEDHRQPAVWLRLAIGAGSIHDPHDRVGLAQMVANMLDKGTATRTESQIADQVDGLGATLGASADNDFLTVSASGLSAYTDTLFDLLSDITLHPIFPTQELERTRTQTLSNIVDSLGSPATLADAGIHRRVYGAHPYGNFALGTQQTIKAITQQDLQQFHGHFFAPNNATLFVAGDVTAEQATAKAEARLGAWVRKTLPPAVEPPSSPAPGPGARQITIIDRPGAAQTEVRIGLLTKGYSDPQRYISRVASSILGLGQFESRLTKEIRVKRGLTYGAASFFDRKQEAGIFEITTFTKNQSTGEVVKIALEEARKLRDEPTPADELQDRKAFLNGSFAVSVATVPGLLQRLSQAVLYGTGPEDLTKYIPEVESVTAAQVQDYMRGLPLDSAQVVLVGDANAIEPQVKDLGAVTRIPAGSLDLQSPTLQGQTGTAANQTPTPTGDALAEGKRRLADAVAALGGDAFLNLKQVTMKGEGEISPPGQDAKLPIASATLTFAPPGRSRFELNTTFGDIIFGSDGIGHPWLSALGAIQDAPTGFGDPTELLRNALAKNYETSALPGLKSQAAGEGELQGIGIKDEKGRVAKIYINAVTHLPRRISVESSEGTLDVLLDDYHTTDKVALPGALRVMQGDKQFVSLKIKSWEINKPVDEKLFQRPKA